MNQPAMSPLGLAVSKLPDRALGPRRGEAEELLELHGDITGEEPVSGPIIGFGEYENCYDSGERGQAPLLAFAPGLASISQAKLASP